MMSDDMKELQSSAAVWSSVSAEDGGHTLPAVPLVEPSAVPSKPAHSPHKETATATAHAATSMQRSCNATGGCEAIRDVFRQWAAIVVYENIR